MPRHIHELEGWPEFQWDMAALAGPLAQASLRQGRLLGRLGQVGLQHQEEALLESLAQEAVRTSEIEGEVLDPESVRSSLARRLGLEFAALKPVDRRVEGVVEMVLDATQRFEAPLTADRLCAWQAALFPTGRSGLYAISVGAWRTGPIQVVSGPIGREHVHFEGPAADRLPEETAAFLRWCEAPSDVNPLLKAALAHLWFVTLHPFDDGNGRVARAVADHFLARAENSPMRFYSMSAQIQIRRKEYYEILESTQKGNLDITAWLVWFLECLDAALSSAEGDLAKVLEKANFWRDHAATALNDRQKLMLNMLLDGFEGKLTSSKWAKITKVSQDTAHRDIIDLVSKDILHQSEAGGRNTSYALGVLEPR